MTTYYFAARRCPGCGATGMVIQCGSCNTFGAKFYTDGYVQGPMYDEGVSLMRCGDCHNYFWWDDAAALCEDIEPLACPGSFDEIRDAEWLKALAAAAWSTPDQERIVRRNAWWASNNQYRNTPDLPFDPDEDTLNNARRLLELTGGDESEVLTRAELLRFLGDFPASLAALATIDNPNLLQRAATIRVLAECGERRVHEVDANR